MYINGLEFNIHELKLIFWLQMEIYTSVAVARPKPAKKQTNEQTNAKKARFSEQFQVILVTLIVALNKKCLQGVCNFFFPFAGMTRE